MMSSTEYSANLMPTPGAIDILCLRNLPVISAKWPDNSRSERNDRIYLKISFTSVKRSTLAWGSSGERSPA